MTSSALLMDKHEMTSGVIPLRHASLPGHVKLPRRYEKAAMGSSNVPLRMRKISIQPEQTVTTDSVTDRLTDLTTAVLWVKQELIMLRQHDILLKRQFIDIQHSLHTLHTQTPPPPPPPLTTASSHITTTTNLTDHVPSTKTTPSTNSSRAAGSLVPHNSSPEGGPQVRTMDVSTEELVMGFPVVRPSSSVTLLAQDSDGECEGEGLDSFCEDLFGFRPRTSSMRTSRDMAALARRRGSKELI